MGNEEHIPYSCAVRQRGEDCTWRAKNGKNIYLSVFPKFLELLSFCLLKFTKNIDLQVMRVPIMLRSRGYRYRQVGILSTVAFEC